MLTNTSISTHKGWRQHLFLLGTIHLLLIDEMHHIGEDRGAVLEIVIVRMRNLNNVYEKRMREINAETNQIASESLECRRFKYFHILQKTIFKLHYLPLT